MNWRGITRNWMRKKYARDEWAKYYQATTGQRPAAPRANRNPRPSGMFRVTAVLVILAVLLVVRQFPHPMGEQVRDNLRYLLTAEWNFQPIMGKTMELAAQLVNWDNPAVQGTPGGKGVSTAPVTGSGLQADGFYVPVSGTVTSEFGWVKSPVDGLERFNSGVVISAPAGTSVVAALGGRVTRIDSDKMLGQFILIDHGGDIYTLYGGVADMMVVEGQTVLPGQAIATVAAGDTGDGGLHFELREKGKLVDPLARLQLPQN